METCLYYLQSRYYCSDIGRFISPESIDCIDFKIINGLNLYCYSNNEPINGAKKKSNESIDYSEFNI